MISENPFTAEDTVSQLLALCYRANHEETDLEEALYARLEAFILEMKDKENYHEN